MAKPRKKASAPEPPPVRQVGDKVIRKGGSETVLEISKVHPGGDQVDLSLAGTNLEWFRVPTDSITFPERKAPARTSNPFTSPGPVFDGGELLGRIGTVQRESLEPTMTSTS